MKKYLLLTILVVMTSVGICYGSPIVGSAFGALQTAKAMGQGKTNLGVLAGFADDRSFAGFVTFGMSRYMDGRFKLGIRDDGSARISLGADFKWQFWTARSRGNEPFDMAIGGLIEYTKHTFGSTFQVGGLLIGSYPFRLDRGGTISPYARFNVRAESNSSDTYYEFYHEYDSRTRLQFGLNAGVEWAPSGAMALYGEFQFDGNDGLFVGIDFNVM